MSERLLPRHVAFRADASLEIGCGHVMRCLALADRLQSLGVRCTFVCRDHPGNLFEPIRRSGHSLAKISPALPAERFCRSADLGGYAHWIGVPEADDAAEAARLLANDPADLIVVDHYALGTEWQQAMRPSCQAIVVIDDLADRPQDCEVILNQNLGRHVSDYDGLVPFRCLRLIGPHYALLRPEFAALRSESLARRKHGHVRSILIAMGGVDIDNVTGEVLTALDSTQRCDDIQIKVMLGASAPWKDEVRAQAMRMRLRVEVMVGPGNVAEVLRDSDLAIGAAGSSSWERCCMGLPALQLVLADNQRGISGALAGGGAAITIDRYRLPEALAVSLANFAKNPERLITMSACAAAVTDGRGTEKVADILLSEFAG